MRKKRIFSIVLSFALLGAILTFTSRLLMPKHVSVVREGALVGEYYIEADEGREHQILFLGDCEAYGCFIPAIIWEASGLTSYVRGSPAARVWQSYYLLLDTLEYEKPDVVVLSVFALCHGFPAHAIPFFYLPLALLGGLCARLARAAFPTLFHGIA